jgi:hypothetical protein
MRFKNLCLRDCYIISRGPRDEFTLQGNLETPKLKTSNRIFTLSINSGACYLLIKN